MTMKEPIAKEIPYSTTKHGVTLDDPYHWLRDQNWPNVKDKKVINYLKSENKYTKAYFNRLKESTDKIFKELKGRIKLADQSVPIKHKNFFYYSKTTAKSQYSTHFRTEDPKKKGEILLDENELAKEQKYFRLGGAVVSSQENLLAYATDTDGDERYTLRIKNLDTKEIYADQLKDVDPGVVWTSDDQGFYYAKLDENWRANRIFYHRLGTSQQDDKLIFHEQDQTFRVGLSKTTDEQYIILGISSSTSDEIRYLKADDPDHHLKMIIERRHDHLCSIDHFNGYLYLVTNDLGKNFRLVCFKQNDPTYQELLGHNKDVYLKGLTLYNKHIAVETTENGLDKIYIYQYDFKDRYEIPFPEPTYAASVIDSDLADHGMHFYYSSLTSPATHYKIAFDTREITTLKVQEIPSGYDKSLYQCERFWAKSRDGKTSIPVSLVYKKALFKHDGSNPLYLYGYGSYGIGISSGFGTNIFTLLDRGFVYAIAHIRGGDDLGFEWYEQAKFLNKIITFDDFIDVAKDLIKAKYTSAGNIVIMGGSAGGMLVGNVINREPGLYKAAIAHVPFVDVLNTMLDENLPLTPGEYKEWGNPQDKEYFDYMLSYSPYDNVLKQNYPHLYITAGLNDPRVTYWESAKWVAKLRKLKTDPNLLLLDTNMSVGHGGNSGRFSRIKDLAKDYAFIFDVFDIGR